MKDGDSAGFHSAQATAGLTRTRLFFLSATALAGAMTAFQRTAEQRDMRRWPAPGRMVEVEDGRRLHVVDHGGRGPTVVIETGSGSLAVSWAAVVDRLREFCRVVTYDRAGYGWSDPPAGWTPRSGTEVSRDLARALEAAGISEPWILVGHSLGGLYVRSLLAERPEAVSGLVLVDSSHEDVMGRLRAQLGRSVLLVQGAAIVIMTVAPRSVARLVGRLPAGRKALAGALDASAGEDAERRVALYLRSGFRKASATEALGMRRTMTDLRQHRKVRDLPLVVVTAAPPVPGSTSMMARIRPVWEELQDDLAALSSNSRHVVAGQGGHFVYVDDPDVVAEAVRSVVQQVTS